MAEPIRPTFYPSVKALLTLRIDEMGGPIPPVPETRAPQRKGSAKEQAGSLKAVPQADGTFLIVPQEGNEDSEQSPATQQDSDDFKIVVIPRTAELGRNGVRAPSQLAMEFKYADLPIDPRAVRACGVELYAGTVSAADFQRGILGETRTVSESGQTVEESLNVVPNVFVDSIGRTRSNLRFEGFVDEWAISLGEDTSPIVSLTCTDLTRLLLDQIHPPQAAINARLPIHEAIAKYLAMFPQMRGMRVQYIGVNPPIYATAIAKTAFQPSIGPPARGGDSRTSAIDYLVDTVGAIGLNVRVRGNTVVVQTARQLFKGTELERRSDDPFNARRLQPEGDVVERRTFVYGRNVKGAEFTRNFSGYAPVNVEVRSYLPDRKKTLVTRFPLKADRQATVNPGGKSEQKWRVVRITGISDQALLQSTAQSAYEMLGRNELGVTVTTRDLGSLGGGNDDPDVLDMEPGDSFDLLINRTESDAERSTVNEVQGFFSIRQRAERYMKERGFPDGLAARYAAALESVGVLPTYFARKISFNWDVDSGLEIKIEGVNYVVIRADKGLPPEKQVEPEPGETGLQEAPEDVVIG